MLVEGSKTWGLNKMHNQIKPIYYFEFPDKYNKISIIFNYYMNWKNRLS